MILFISYTDTIKEVSIEIENVNYVSAQSGKSTKRKYVETGDDQGYTTVMSKKQNKHSFSIKSILIRARITDAYRAIQ